MENASELYKEALALRPVMVGWRRTLHRRPECGLQVPNTSAFVQERLVELGIPFATLLNGNCVVAIIGHGGPCIMLRADMDGLPIREQSGEPFSSENGCMHACGHDLHTASLLGAAALLKRREGALRGTVKLLFQPAEETFEGARAAVAAGVLENPQVNAALGLHVESRTPVGTVRFGSVTMASVYGFRITVTGKGGHGSTPENCVDPIVAAIKIHEALETLMSREKSPFAEAVLTIGKFQAGDAANVIPEQAVMEGTLRAFDPVQRAFLVERIAQIAPAVAATYRATARVETLTDVPELRNDDALVRECLAAATAAIPNANPVGGLHAMGSEDFAIVAQRVPTAYFMLGARVDGEARSTANCVANGHLATGKSACCQEIFSASSAVAPGERGVPDAVSEANGPFGHHTPRVRFNEDYLPQAATIYAASALNWLANHSR